MELEPVLPHDGVLRGATCVPVFARTAARIAAERPVRLGAAEWVTLVDVPAGAEPFPLPGGAAIERAPLVPREPLVEAEVVVCMATFDPDPALLAAQLESLRAQTLRGWRCVVSDESADPARRAELERLIAGDDRFVLVRGERAGFYGNFERALGHVGPATRHVALADQDDRWHPEKLAQLTERLDASGADLAFADPRLVDPDGRVLGEPRGEAPRDLDQLLLENVVPGASAVFRRSLLDLALPFPVPLGAAYHDHWLALLALAGRGIEQAAEPLWDYVQHDANAVGHSSVTAAGPAVARGDRLRAVFRSDVIRIAALARTLALRTGRRSYLGRVERDLRAQLRAAAAAPIGRDLLAAALLRRLDVSRTSRAG